MYISRAMKKTKKYRDGGNLFLSMAEGGSMGTVPSMYGELPQYGMGMDVDPLLLPYAQDFEHYYGGNYPILQNGGENYNWYVTGLDNQQPAENTLSYDDAMKQYMVDYMKARYADIETANPRTLQDRIPYPTMPMTERQQRRVEEGKNPSTFFKYYPQDPSFAGTRDLNNWSNQAMENAGLSGFETRFRKDVSSPEDMEEENNIGGMGNRRRSGKANYDLGASDDARRRNSKVKECVSCKNKRKSGSYRQFGGDGDDSQMSADQDFYSKKLNAFINKIRENDENGRMQEYQRIMEEGMPEEGMELEARYGLQMPSSNPYQTQNLYDGSNLDLYADAANSAKGISQGLYDFKNRARLFGPKVKYYDIKNKFHEGYSPDVLKAQEEMNEKINQMNNGYAYGGQPLPGYQGLNGQSQVEKLRGRIVSGNPAFQPIDFGTLGAGAGSNGAGTGTNGTGTGTSTNGAGTNNQYVTINGQQYLVGPNNQLYSPFTGGNNNMLYDGYNNYGGNMYMPYINFRSKNRLTGDFRDAMLAGMYNDSNLTASMINSRRALLPGNRVKSMIYQFGELPAGTAAGAGAGTGTGTGTAGAGTQSGAPGVDGGDDRGFFGRLFGSRYNDSRFDPSNPNPGNPEIKRTSLTSQFNPDAKSEYDVFRPRRAERVSNRLENVGNKLDRMYGYKQYMEDLNTAYSADNPMQPSNYSFSEREQDRVNRLTKRYNKIASNDNRPVRPGYSAPTVTKKEGGELPKAKYGPPIAFNPAAGMNMIDPCPPNHYWDERLKECVPFGKSVPTKEQFYDPELPYNQWIDELNYKRNRAAYDKWRGEQRSKYKNDNFKGEKYIKDEYGNNIPTPEYQEFLDSDGYRLIKERYKELEDGSDDFDPDYKEQNFFDQNKEWDEDTKRMYNELFNTDEPTDNRGKLYRDKMKQDLYEKQNPGKMPEYDYNNPEPFRQFYKENVAPIQLTPEQIIKGNYDNWCPCMKKQVIDFVEGKPITQDVCVPCEEMPTAMLGYQVFRDGGSLGKFIKQYRGGGPKLPKAQYGLSPVAFNPQIPSLPDSLSYMQNIPMNIGGNNLQYPANPYLPGDKKWQQQQEEEELNNDPYYVEQKLSRKKTLFNPDRFLAKERFAANFLDQANTARMQEQLAEASRAGNLFTDLPMNRGFYNPQSGKFMGDVPVFNTGFSGYMAQGGSIIDNLKEGDEVPLTAEQIKELERRGITYSILD